MRIRIRYHCVSVLIAALVALAVTFPTSLSAAECQPDDISLASQRDIDEFQSNHGPCDRVEGGLSVQGLDVTSLAGLADIVRVGGDLEIAETEMLTDLEGLSGIATVGGNVGIFHNFGLLSLDGLSSLHTVEGGFGVFANPLQTDVDALSSLTEVGDYMVVSDLHSLVHVDGLRSLVVVGNHLGLMLNHSLRNVEGLSALVAVGGNVSIGLNDSLSSLDGLESLTTVGFNLHVFDNTVLSTLDGLAGLTAVGFDVRVEANPALAACTGLLRVLDAADHGEPGPGPSGGGVPDVGGRVVLRENLRGCNSIEEIAESRSFRIHAGLNDAWRDPATPGQGLFVTVLPDIGHLFLAWMTYDIERPGAGATALLGDPGHRWFTAFGPYEGNAATLDLMLTRGGIFDSIEPEPQVEPYGTVQLRFVGCNAGTLRYDIASAGRHDVFHIERIAHDNIDLCESPLAHQ